MPPSSPAFRAVSTAGLVLGLALLGLCVWIGVYSWFDTSSSTAALGVLVAVALAVPVLVGLGLTAAGIRSHRRSGGADGMALATVGTSIVVAVALLVALQLLLGS